MVRFFAPRMSFADRIAHLEAYIDAVRAAELTVVGGGFSEVEAVQQRFRTHDPEKLARLREKAEADLARLRATGGRGGVVMRQGR